MPNKLHELKENILNYLLESEKNVNDFDNDIKIKLGNKWNNILNYPSSLYTLRNTSITKSQFIDRMIAILKDKTIRVIHPILFIIFYNELTDEHIKYCSINNGKYIKLLPAESKKTIYNLRDQTIYIFKIYWRLINDDKIKIFNNFYYENNLVENLINSLYYNVKVEDKKDTNDVFIETKKMRFCDLSINLDFNNNDETSDDEIDLEYEFKNQILIEINENHHQPKIDYLRKQIIYLKTGKSLIFYETTTDEKYFDNLYLRILKEISKIIYKNYDKYIGIMFYLYIIENIDLEMSKLFLDIHFYKRAAISTILNIFEGWEFINKKKFLKKVIKNLNSPVYFINKDEIFEDSILSSIGITKLLFLPSVGDFNFLTHLVEFAEIYDKFRDGFFKTIESFLNNDEDEELNKDLRKKYVFKEELKQLDELYMYFFLKVMKNYLNDDLLEKIKIKFDNKYELDNDLPFFINKKDKYNKFDKTILINKFGEQIKKIIEETYINDSTNIENKCLTPIKIIDYIIECHQEEQVNKIKKFKKLTKKKLKELNIDTSFLKKLNL